VYNTTPTMLDITNCSVSIPNIIGAKNIRNSSTYQKIIFGGVSRCFGM